MVLRPKSKALSSSYSYTCVAVEPCQKPALRWAQPLDTGGKSLLGQSTTTARFSLSNLWRAGVGLASFALVAFLAFLLIWDYLFAIDVGSVLAGSGGGGLAIEKTFTVR